MKELEGIKEMRVFASLLMIAITLSGCTHKFTGEKVRLAIVIGKTTKQGVLDSFGTPDKKLKTAGMKMISGKTEIVINNSSELWIYSPHRLKWLDSIEPEPLKIVFDEKGVVTQYEFKDDD